MTHHVIYIPGIGDHRSYGQNIAIQLWRLFGLTPHYLPLGWRTKEGFDRKLKRLLERIDLLRSRGDTVSLVGISAGASVVLAAYAQRPELNGVVCICGKIQNPGNIKSSTYAINPDFKESMRRVQTNLELLNRKSLLKNVMSMYALRDRTVPPEDARIKGAAEKIVPGWDHGSGIFFGVVLGAPAIAGFLRSGRS
jgi:pimeloyl-ACP methyl ester carboxylesterase